MTILIISLYFTFADVERDTPTQMARNFNTTAECEQYKAEQTPNLNKSAETDLIAYSITCKSV
jgi:hypothetical protein